MRLASLIASCAPGLAACYSPELADCAVSCRADLDCAADQACIGGSCRAPGVTCEGDGSAARVELRVEVMGDGLVIVDDLGTCSAEHVAPHDEQCTWQVAVGRELALEARAIDDKPFERWLAPACEGQDATCTFVATEATSVVARFR